MLSKAFLLLCLSASALATTTTRAEVVTYLQTVYALPTAAQWTALSDDQVFTLYQNLTFYFPGAPEQDITPKYNTLYPSGRSASHPYAGTVCDCLHISLDMCQTFNAQSTCAYWPVSSYLNMDYVRSIDEGFPSNAWFEGLSFPGEWAFPMSCNNANLGNGVYGFDNHIWLYPITGFGVWWNTGSTAWAYNKVAWLMKYGVGQTAEGTFLGNTKREVFNTLVETVCPNYQNRTNIYCDSCPYSQTGSTTLCCCHGPGYNLGAQVLQTQANNGGTLDQAIDTVMGYYENGAFGQDQGNFPVGTYFAYRNLLDNYFISIQNQQSYDSVQFIREPQHSGGSGTPSDPAYAFEFLMHNSNWQYNWQSFCSSNSIALLNPLDHLDTYTSNGYIVNNANLNLGSVSQWTPTTQFTRLFSQPAGSFQSAPDTNSNNADAHKGNSASIAIGVSVAAALVVMAVVGVVVYRRRTQTRYIEYGVEMKA